MLLESLVKTTVELQGFRVVSVTGNLLGLVAELAPDARFTPRCGSCGGPALYRDTRRARRFRHVPMWGIPVELRYAPRRVSCPRCEGVHVETMPWVSGQTAHDPGTDGDAVDLGTGVALAAGFETVPVLLGHSG